MKNNNSYQLNNPVQNKFLNRILLPIVFLFLSLSSVAQVAGDYRSLTTGNWNVNTTWERYDGASWVAATAGQTPGVAAGAAVLIRDGHTVTFNATPTNALASLTVGEGVSGILQYHNSLTAVTMTVTGTTTVASNGIFQSFPIPTTSGTHSFSTSGSIVNNGTINFYNFATTVTSAVNTTITSANAGLTYSGSGTNTFNNFTQSNTSASPGYSLSGADLNVKGTFTITSGCTFSLNGRTVSVGVNFTNSAAAANTGLNSSIAGSKIVLNGTGSQPLTFGNQTFSAVVTTPDLEVSNPNTTTNGAYSNSVGSIRNLTVLAGAYFQVWNTNNLNISGNILNNGNIIADGFYSTLITFNGTSSQTVSGTGVWSQISNNPGTGLFPGFAINNTAGVVLNQNVGLTKLFTLTAGAFSGTGTLTLGNGTVNTFTTTVVAGTIPPAMVAYNLANTTYNLTYNNTSSYTTGGELPSVSATVPANGTMTMSNGATVVLGNDGTIFNVTINNSANSILRLNGKNLRVAGTFTNSATTINTMGLDASVANSKITLMGTAAQPITFNNQTFSSVVTAPDLEVSNTNSSTNGAYTSSAGSIRNLTVLSNAYLQIYFNYNLNISGNLLNNGTIFSDGSYTGLITFNGTSSQTVSGTGTWNQVGTNAGTGLFPGFAINNTAGVVLNQSLAITRTFTLTAGVYSGTGTLTLGNGVVATTLTVNVVAGSIPASMVAYNLSNITYNLNYNNTSSYTTGGELPSLSATPPVSGTMTMSNGATVVLGNDGTFFNVQINNSANSILRMNGKTLRVAGSFTNSAATVNTMGLDASVANSKLSFIGTVAQDIQFGNQTFSSAVTAPDIDVSNSNSSGARVVTTTNATVKNITILSGGYFQIGNNSTITLNVTGNITNNGYLMGSGSTADIINMNGTSAQTISGTGIWSQLNTNPSINTFPGLGINNAAGVALNQSFALSNVLNLTAGTFSGTGTLTLGNGVNVTLTTNVVGGILPPSMTAYNLVNQTYNLNYNNTSSYNTGGELPSLSAIPPAAGAMTISSGATVVMNNDGTVFNVTITNAANSILRLNGRTLRLAGSFTNNAATVNTMGFDAGVAGSKLSFINTTAGQNLTFGNQTFSSVVTAPDIEVSNTYSPTGVSLQAAGSVRNVIVNSSSYLQFANATLNVAGNITNNGTIFVNGGNTSASVTMNGTSAQTISGTGTWLQVGTNAAVGVFPGLIINNSSGVVLNQNLGLQNTLTLTNGVLSSSNASTLYLGNIAGTLTTTRTNGSLNISTGYNLTGITYNVNYNATNPAIAIITGTEIPPSSYLFYRAGTMTMNNTTVSGGVILGASSNINSLSVSASTTLDLSGFTLGIYGTYTNSGILNASNAASTLLFNGIAAQSMSTGTLTSSYISNVTVNNNLGFTFNNTVQIGSASINGVLNLIAGATTISSATTLTVFGSFSGSGTLSSGSSNAALSLQGTAGNMGTINLTSGAQTFTTLTVSIGGATPQVTIIGNLTINTLYTMTSGVVNMGPYSVIYSTSTTTPMLIANQNSGSYFTFLGGSSGLQWNMSGTVAGTYRWNVGPSGTVSGWRPVTIQTLATQTSNVKIGFINLDGTGTYSASNIPNSGGNVNANYIANLTVSGAGIGTPNVTMEYQNGDFNTAPSAASNVKIWYYNMPASPGTSIWTSTGTQTSNGTNGSNTTIVKNAALALTAGVYPLNLAETNNDAGNPNNTWIWTGTTSSSWNVTTNWSPASVPGTGANIGVNVLIPQRTNQPNMDVAASIGDITVNSGAILTLTLTNTLTVAGNFYNNGTLTYSSTGSTVTYTGTGKLIAPGTYYNLTSSGATTPVLSSFGTIVIANTFTPGSAVYTYTGSTITFNGSSTQNIPAFAYFNNVNFNATTSNTLTGAISVFGNMTINTGTFNDGGFVATGPGSGSGIFTLASGKVYTSTTTGTNALPIFQTYVIDPSSTVNLNGANTAAQNIPAASYGIMVITNGGTNAKTALGNITIKGNLTVTSGTLNDGGFIITACGNVTNNSLTATNGSITSTGSGKLLLSAGTAVHTVTTATTGTVAFGNMELNDVAGATFNNGATTTGITNVTGTMTVTTGNLTISNFTSSLTVTGTTSIGGAGTLTFSSTTGTKTFGDVTINGAWNNSINGAITVSGNFTNNGSFASGSGANTLSGAAKSINGTSATTFTSLNVTGTYTNNITSASGGVTVSTTFSGAGGTFTNGSNALLTIIPATASFTLSTLVASASGNTVVYNGGSAQTIRGIPYYNLTYSPTATATGTLGAATTVNNNLTITTNVTGVTATFADGGFLLTGPGTGNGTLDMSTPNTTVLTLTNTSLTPTSPFPTFQAYNMHTTASTVNFSAAVAQDITNAAVTSLSFGNLSILASGAKRAMGAVTVKGNLTITTGSLADNGNTITVNGNITNNGGHSSTGGGSITLNGGIVAHTLSGTGAYGNLTLNDTQGSNMSSSFTVNGALALASGNFNINTLTLTLAGTFNSTGGFLYGTTSSVMSVTGTGTLGSLVFAPSGQNLSSITINRTSSGLVNLGSNLNLNAAGIGLTLSNGLFNLVNSNLSLAYNTTISGGSVTAMVVADATGGNTGQMMKTFSNGSTAAFTFPIGDVTSTTEYSPVAITMSANSQTRTIGVNVSDAQHPNDGSATNYVSRYWTFSDNLSGAGSYSYNATYTAVAADIVGTYSTLSVNWWNGSAWNPILNTGSTPTLVYSNGTQASAPLNYAYTGRVGSGGTYTWLPTSGNAEWALPSNWSPARNVPFPSDILLFNQGGSSVALNVPTQTVAQIQVSNNTDVSLQATTTNTLSINGASATTNLSIAAGSNFEVSTSSVGTMTLNFITTTGQLASISGTLTTNTNGTFTTTNSTTTFQTGSTYMHNRDGGTIPTATWASGSTLNVSGVTTTSPSSFTGTFGNLTWSSPGLGTTAAMTLQNNLLVSAGILSFGTVTVNVAGNVTNNGTINCSTGTLNMNGTSAQVISGTGSWITSTPNTIYNLTINNAAGVDLQNNLSLQNTLTLTNGVLSSSNGSTFTFGNGVGGTTITTNRTFGSIGSTLNTSFNLLGAGYLTYNVNFNTTSAGNPITTGGELPPTSYNNYVNGTMTVANATTNGGVILGQNANINSLTMNLSTTFDLNGKTLGIFGSYSNSGTLTGNAAASALNFNGNVGQTFSIGTYTGSLLSNLVSSETNSSTGLSLSTTINLGSLTVNPGCYLLTGNFTVNVARDITNNGTIFTSGANTSALFVMNGSSVAQTISGTGVWNQITTNAGTNRFPGLTINNTSGQNPSVNLNQSFALQTAFNLTNGILDGTGTMIYGIGTGTFTMTRTGGSMLITPDFATGLTGTTFNVVYGNGVAVPNITTGPEIPYTPSVISGTSFTINNPTNGVTLSNNVTTGTSNVLTLTSGILTLGNNNFTVSNTAAGGVSGGSATTFVAADATGGSTGQLIRAIPTLASSTTFAFPVGDVTSTAEYSPVSLNFTSNTVTARNIGVKVTDTQHPNDGTANNYITRYWTFTDSQSGTGAYTYTPTFTFLSPADLVGAYASLFLDRWDGANWSQYTNASFSPNLSATSITNVTAPLNGSDFTGRVNDAIYSWTGAINSDWQNAGNWSPNRTSIFVTDVLQFANGGTYSVTNVPTQTIRKLLVSNNTNVTLQAVTTNTLTINGFAAVNNVSIATGSTLQISSGTGTLTLTYGTTAGQLCDISGGLILFTNGTFSSGIATTTVTVAGTVTLSGGTYTATSTATTVNGSVTYNTGTITSTTANLTFANGSFFNLAGNAGSIPTATYYSNPTITTSTVNITGTTTTNPTGFSGAIFSNLVWNCAGQTSATGAINGAMTVNGNLTVSAGTFADGGSVITGNATGTFSVASGATYTTTRSATSWFPTNFIAANISLDPNSTFNYAAITGHTIPNTPVTTYGILGITGAVVKTLSAPTTVSGISINTNSATLADGGNLITGPGTGSGLFNVISGGAFTMTNTNANPMPVFQNYTFGSTSTVNYNGVATQNIYAVPSPGYGNFSMGAAAAAVRQLAGTTYVQTQVATSANNTFDLNGNTITIAGATPFSQSATATLTANAAGSTIHLNGTVAQTMTIAGTITGTLIANLTSSNTNAATGAALGTTPATYTIGNLTINPGSYFNLNGRTMNLTGSYTNNGTLIGNATSSILAFTGTSPQSFTIGTYNLSQLFGMTINNAAGVTLGAPVNIVGPTTTTGIFTLTSGTLTTTAANLLTVSNTAVAAISGGSPTSYVNGPLARVLPVNLASGNYAFPVGGGAYQLFELTNATTNAAGTVTVTVEAHDANSAGTAGPGFASLNTDQYWSAIATGAGSITSVGSVSLTDASPVLTASNAIGQSTTQSGTYALKGGTVVAPKITTTGIVSTTLGYFVIGTKGGNLCGTYTVGAGIANDFVNLTAASLAVNNATITCDVIFELQSDYSSASETFPITFNQFTYTGGPYNVTVRPAAGVTPLITGSNTTSIISFNGADKMIFDGRQGGTTNPKSLTIANTSTSGRTFEFLNDATNNTIEYCVVKGVNTSTIDGVVVFGTSATGTTGNDFNTIDNCDLQEGATTPVNMIYGAGTTAKVNDNITISNNNIFNFWSATQATNGVLVSSNNSDWTISGNSFYQTTNRTSTAGATHNGIQISNASGNNFIITNNFIGGTSANAGGTPWTVGGSFANRFIGIQLNVGTTTASSVQGNVIKNFTWSSTSGATTLPGVWCGIYANAGSINIGSTSANTIGSATGNGSVTVTISTTGGISFGIGCTSTGAINISNNIVGSITLLGNSTSVSNSFTGIGATSGNPLTMFRNTIGSSITGNSINAATASTSTTGQKVSGIENTSANVISITENEIANLNNNYAGTGTTTFIPQVRGIASSAGTNTINLNVVHGLSSSAPYTGTAANSSVIGVSMTSITAGTTISQNTIDSLMNSANAAVAVTGLYYSGATTGSNLIERNFIHTLDPPNVGALVNGIYVNAGNSTYQNNMISLGMDAAGNSITTGYATSGINEAAGTNNYYHNSIYIGGSGVASSANTFAFQSAVASGTRSIQDNVFYNARSNASGTGKNYAIKVGAVTGLTCNYNDELANGTGAVTGAVGTTDYVTFANWRSGTSFDLNGFAVDPMFINPAGNVSSVNLHIQPPPTQTPVESLGTNIATVTTDFDGDSRASNTPVDVGADAGNFAVYECTGAVAGTGSASPTGPFCASGSSTVTINGINFGTGISYQWQSSPDGTLGSYTDISGATNISYATGTITVTTYYRCVVSCTPSTTGDTSTAVTIIINQAPTATIDVTGTVNVCSPGASQVFNAITNATSPTYQWKRNNVNIAGATNSSVTATLSGSYTVLITDLTTGCSATSAATVLNFVAAPTISSVTATPAAVCSGGNSQLAVNMSSNSDYTVSSISYAPVTGTVTNLTALWGDDLSTSVAIPFTFNFFNVNYTTMTVYTNGFVQLGASSGSTTVYQQTIPNISDPNKVIAACWNDLDLSFIGNIRTILTGVAPNRIFSIQYQNCPFYDGGIGTGNLLAQIELYENGGFIEVHVGQVSGTSTTTANKTLGVENTTGTHAITPAGRNGVPWTVSSEAWRFTPSGLQYSWSPATFLNNTTIYNPLASNVTSATTYTVTVTDILTGCTVTGSVLLPLASDPVPVATSSGPVCEGSTVVFDAGLTGMTSYSWSGPNGFTSTLQGPILSNAQAINAGTYIVTVTNSSGCTGTSSTVLIVNPNPTLSVFSQANVSCNGGTDGAVTVEATGGVPAYLYDLNGNSTLDGIYTGLAAGNYPATVIDDNGCEDAITVNITEPDAISVSTSFTEPACNGGSNGTITVTASGGTGTLVYSKDGGANYQSSNIFTGLTAGTYSIFVKDANNCTGSTSETVTEPTAISLSTSQTNVNCNGGNDGSITVTASGGTGTLQYSNDNGSNYQAGNIFNTLTAGIYTVVVKDANNCTASSVVTITEPTTLSVSTTQTNVTVNGGNDGSITVTASGGTPAYQYSKDGGSNYQAGNVFSNLTAGVYTVVVKDANNCTASTTVTITEPASISVSTSQTDVSCNGGSDGTITVTATGGAPPIQYSKDGGANYQAGNLFTGLSAGIYSIFVKDANNNTASTSVTITEPPAISVSTSQVNVNCNGGNDGSITVTASGGTGTLEYSNNGGTSYQAGNVFSNLIAGTYSIFVKDANNCTASTSVTITEPAVLAFTTSVVNVSCPGSSDGSITVNATGGTTSYQYSKDNGGTFQASNLFSGLAAGNYDIVVKDAHNCITSATTVTVGTVPDVTAPVPDVTNLPNVTGQCSATVTVTPTATDNCSGSVTGSTLDPLTYSTQGTFTVHWSYDDGHGNISTQNQTVIVDDITNPVLNNCPLSFSSCNPVTWTPPTATDNCGSATVNGSHTPGTNFPPGTTTVTYTADDGNGNASQCSFDVTVIPAPTAAISGGETICLGQPTTVHVVYTGTGPWNYTISDGTQNVTGSSSNNPDDVIITPTSAGTHVYTVTALSDVNCNGSGSGSVTVIVNTTPPSTTITSITGAPDGACSGDVKLITANYSGGSGFTFSWNTGTNSSVVKYSDNAGGPFVNGPFATSGNTVYAQFGALVGANGYNVCAQALNGCGSSVNKCYWIRGKVSVPGTIIGPSVACPNDVKNYSCGVSGGAATYSWTFSVPGAVITNNGTQNVQVTFPTFTTGQLCVTAALSCGGSSASAPRCLTITNAPIVPGAFTSGPSKVCPGATNVVFTVPASNYATGYNWTVPAGSTIVSGQNTTSISVNFPSVYTGAPPVCVYATSGCASSPGRCKTVGSHIPIQPGSMSGPATNVCNSTVQYSVANVAGATSFTWTIPSGTSNLVGQGTTSIQFQVGPTFNTGQVTVVANTTMCTPGVSPPRTITITGKPANPANIISNPLTWCAGAAVNFSIASPPSPIPSYSWTTTNGTITAGQGSTNVDIDWGTGQGYVRAIAYNSCGASGTQSKSFTSTCREEENGVVVISGSQQLAVYPNPAHDKISVELNTKADNNFNMVLMDMSGRSVLSENIAVSKGLNTFELDITHFAKGIYTLRVQSVHESHQVKIAIE